MYGNYANSFTVIKSWHLTAGFSTSFLEEKWNIYKTMV